MIQQPRSDLQKTAAEEFSSKISCAESAQIPTDGRFDGRNGFMVRGEYFCIIGRLG
jgi:hypothetical protein